VGHYLKALTAQWARLDAALPVRGGVTEVRHIQRVFARPTTATFSGIKDLERLAVAIL
jgi:hypothetical protein